MDLQNSFTTAKSSKFSTKPILCYPPHLKYIATLLFDPDRQDGRAIAYSERSLKIAQLSNFADCNNIENFA